MSLSKLQLEGSWLRKLVPHQDHRGALYELFRADWAQSETPLQWNLVRTSPNTLRGVHVHLHHDDYLIVLSGTMYLGLHDLRPGSSTEGRSELVVLGSNELQAAFVPRGVMHGFCFLEAATYVYGLTQCWTPEDDLGCRWDDPELNLNWPVSRPMVSARDDSAVSLAELKTRLGVSGARI